MNNYLQKLLVPSFIKQWNRRLLLRYPLLSITKAVYLVWILMVFLAVSILCPFLVSLETWNGTKNESRILLELGVALAVLFVLVQWYHAQAKYSRMETSYLEKMILYFLEVGMLFICLAVPASFTYLFSAKTNNIISEESLARDIASLKFLNLHAGSWKDLHISSEDQIDSDPIDNIHYVERSLSLDSLVNGYYTQLGDSLYQANVDLENLLTTTGLKLSSKYKVAYDNKMLKRIEAKIQSTYVSVYATTPWENQILRWCFLALLIFPQIAFYEKIKNFFSTLGLLIVSFILLNTILLTFLYVFGIAYEGIFNLKIELLLLVLAISFLLLMTYRIKTRNQFVLKAVIALHLVAFIFMLYNLWDLNPFLLSCLGLILALAFERIYISIASLPELTVKIRLEKERTINVKTTIKHKAKPISPRINGIYSIYESFNKAFYKKTPLIHDTKILPACIVMIVLSTLGVILAQLLDFDFNEQLSQFLLIGDPTAVTAFYFSLLPIIIWAVYFHKKKIDLTHCSNVFGRSLLIWGTILLVSTGFFLSIYTYNFIRYKQLLGQISESTIKKEVKSLLALFDYGNRERRDIGMSSLSENWNWLKGRFDYLEKQMPDSTTVIQKLGLEKFNYSLTALENNVPELFIKYKITHDSTTTLASILERESLAKDLDTIIYSVDTTIRLHYFKKERLANLFGIFVALAVISMMLFLGKTLPIKPMGWMYFLPFGIPLILNYPTGLETWNLFNYPLAAVIFGGILLLIIQNFRQKNKPALLFAYELFFLLALDLGYKVLPLLLPEHFLFSFMLAIAFTVVLLLVHAMVLKKFFALPFDFTE